MMLYTILKLTCLVGGTNPSTLERKRGWYQQVGESKSTSIEPCPCDNIVLDSKFLPTPGQVLFACNPYTYSIRMTKDGDLYIHFIERWALVRSQEESPNESGLFLS